MIAPESVSLKNLPSVSFKDKSLLPSLPGIYLISDEYGKVQYIGQSFNIKKRLAAHHREADIASLSCPSISWIIINTSNRQTLHKIESQFIRHFKPILNNKIILRKRTVKRIVGTKANGLLSLNIGSVDLSYEEIDLLKVAARISKASMRQFVREIVLEHLKTYKLYYQRQVDYVAKKYGMSPQEAFDKLKTQQPPLSESTCPSAPTFEESLSVKEENNNIRLLLANCGIEDDGEDLLGSFADLY